MAPRSVHASPFKPNEYLIPRPTPLLQLEADFAERWQAGQVAGWEDRGEGGAAATGDGVSGALDLDAFDSADELEMLGAAWDVCIGGIAAGWLLLERHLGLEGAPGGPAC